MVAVNETTNGTESATVSLARCARGALGRVTEPAPLSRSGLLSSSSGRHGSTRSREEWLRLYAGRVLRTWLRQQAPLGLARSYLDQIKRDLADCYDEPLKRTFIETTY